MIEAFIVCRQSFRDFWDEMYILVLANVIWLGLCLLVIPGPPATAGLYYLTNRVAHGRSVGLGIFFEGLRRYFIKGWLWAMANVLFLAVMGANFSFYGRFQGFWVQFVKGLFLGAAVLWLALQLYTFPLLLEQEDERLRVALGNALFMALKNPGFTLVLVILVASIVALSLALVLPIGLLAISFIALLSNHAVLGRLEAYRIAREKKESKGGVTDNS